MTTREYAEAILVWRDPDIADVEDIIKAAVEEDRRARPHAFVGRTDRHCELCNEPDRDEIHIASREMMRNRLELAVEEEREACAKILDNADAEPYCSFHISELARQIRARSNPAE